MAIVTPIRIPTPGEETGFFQKLVERSSYQTYAGNPTNNVVPRWIGDRCLDTSNNKWYLSHGTAAANWKAAT